MRISDWSSDVCSSDLLLPRLAATDFPERSPMSFRLRTLLPVLFGALLAAPAVAQDEYVVDLSRIDPSAILASAGDVLMRAPDPAIDDLFQATHAARSEEHTSELQSLMRIPYAVFCL